MGLGGEAGVRGGGEVVIVVGHVAVVAVSMNIVHTIDTVHSIFADILLQLYRQFIDQLIIRL